MVLPSFRSVGGTTIGSRNSYSLSRKQRFQRWRWISFILRFCLASIACLYFLLPFVLYASQKDTFLSPEAYPVYGIRADDLDGVVYAVPQQPPKGIVLLLHACTHNAYKFFAPSSTCKDCIGLAEEMRLARIVLERGYVALAVTASSGGVCWGGQNDIARIQTALHVVSQYHQANHVVYAIGASSGGSMAAKLVAEGIAESAAVMVMGLRDQLLDTILSKRDGTKKLYLAPMPRDRGTTKKVRDNEAHWIEKQQGIQQKHQMIVDEISCIPLPVTADYLWNRVPGMTHDAAETIVDVLLNHKHLDPKTRKLVVDPTRSNWRDFFLKTELVMPADLAQTNNSNKFLPSNNAEMLLWETFDLTPGISPLAKALHRAWAMHEYCSETVDYALDFFEGQKTRDEILAILEDQQRQQQSQR